MNISIYGGHNASVYFYDGEEYHIIELERLMKERYYMLFDKSENEFISVMESVLNIAKNKWGIDNDFDTCAYGINGATHIDSIKKVLRVKNIVQLDHHLSHAYCAFYQSDFDESIIISYDGGGNDGVFNFYLGSKKNGLTKLNFSSDINLGQAYMMTSYPISEIKNIKGDLPYDLALSGKLMGLVAYGKVIDKWVDPIKNFYKSVGNWNLKSLGNDLGLNLEINSLSGSDSYNLASTSQFVFEEIFNEVFESFLIWLKQQNLYVNNFCLTGGCALNVLLNQKLMEKFLTIGYNLFIPPNTDDGGLALGQHFFINKEINKKDITFNGLPIVDEDSFEFYKKKYKNKKVTILELCEYLSDGKIVGIIEGDSEVGPRALGHRSIICDPSFVGMKDVLNSKVKFREWYRPFAPVSREFDSGKYFEVNQTQVLNNIFMSYSPKVKNEFRKKLPSITHEDGTSRLQVVFKKNSTFYKILDGFEELGKIPVLLNTSFNIKGKPILSSYEDAFSVLLETELDAVYSQGYLFEK